MNVRCSVCGKFIKNDEVVFLPKPWDGVSLEIEYEPYCPKCNRWRVSNDLF